MSSSGRPPAAATGPGGAPPPEGVYRALFETSEDAILITTPAGTVLRANAAACRLFHRSEAELCRGGRAEGVERDDALRAFLAERALTGEANRELHVRDPRGAILRIEASSSVILHEGTARYARLTFRDVTAARRADQELRESELKLRLLADAMPQIVCVLAPDGTPQYVNHSWRVYSGLTLRGTRRAGWIGLLHPDDVPAAMECRRRALRSRSPQNVEVRYRAADGTYRWFLSRLAPVAEGDRVVRLVGAAMEIQDRKDAEEALRAANTRLADADRRKDDFLGELSHELRNPLAPIRQAVFLLRHAQPGDAAAPLAVIERQVDHLSRLVGDLLDVTRIARGKVDLQRTALDLGGVARRAADDFRGRMEAAGVTFDAVLPDAPVWVDGDETRLAQIVSNLLTNAAKFTRAGDRVGLTVDTGGGEARLRVRDTGAGIEPAMLASVFAPFVQAERTRDRAEGGLGLGLALVKGLVALHGGSVRAESGGKGRGSTFTVALPLGAPATARAPAGAAPGGAPASGRRVLVVDDDRDAANTLALLAAALGHDADVAYDARSALEKLRERRPDVVLCDLGLPGMDGYEFARRVRSSGQVGIRLVAVSGYARPEDVARAAAAGFDAHVAKPPDPQRIAAVLSDPPAAGRDGRAQPPAPA